uniref:Diphthine--ammonia ligase n=1 Tax=Musca domestica TaxID=7370 RepID=A0A1I8MEF6_MUSDO
MRVVAMVSGGKDSCYNMMQCVAEGHEIVALANLHPKDRDELDSFMYQTVGHMGIEILAKAMGLPLYRQETKGKSTQTGKHYVPTDNDEVEDLYNLLATCKEELQAEAVAVGAILSDYQRVRVENVCSRLNLVSLAYLWRRDQTELLQEMIDCQVHAILIKVATLGLVPDRHLGKSLREIQPHLLKMRDKYGLNVCGEGGEYETFTLDCPLFKQRIVVEDVQTVISSADPICPVGYINFTKLSLQPKEPQQSCDVFVKKSLDYISDLNESTYSDLSDPDLSETELELIEKETRMRESLSQNELISRSNSFGRHLATSSSPIPIVTKSASVDEQTPSALLSSSAALCAASLQAGSFGPPRPLGSSTAAVCGSLSLAISSMALTTTGGLAGGNAGSGMSSLTGGIGGGGLLGTQPPSPLKYEREFRPLNNRPMVTINSKGWMWVAGIQGCAPTLEEGMQIAIDSLRSLAIEHNYEMTNYCYITLYVRSIGEYQILNRIYGQAVNFQNPPTRVCVECPLPEECHVIIEAIAFKSPQRRRATISIQESEGGAPSVDDIMSTSCSSSTNDDLCKRHTMHVQSISHWAPANIGPYSQSTKIGEITYISGQIALVPGSMTIIEGGIRPQCKLTLRHISRIAKAMNAQGQLRDVVHGICFVTHPAFIAEARRQWERRTTNAIMDYIVVPALPREALVEWQVWAHTHNDRFEYEETGCSISDYTISIRRRWNYENNCAAIVCYVSTGMASSTTQLTQLSDDVLTSHCRLAQNLTGENVEDIVTYVVNRLLKDYPLAKSNENLNVQTNASTTTLNNGSPINAAGSSPTIAVPAIHLKVFYQVTATPSIDLLLTTLNDFRDKYHKTANIAFTVIPACSLNNFSTFLSICGVRHE